MKDLEKLFDFMKSLNEKPDAPVTHADLIHTIHLVIGSMGEQAETVTRAIEAAGLLSGE